ncbi:MULTISPECIES: DUF1217 domain-containing protein [unclassified Roseitalea]|uniref:DUF1217 domain-containing protein n=1 Tax=unclassified Roseitalea TaxID=2639107 RepID=UPI00273D08DC|nr:MULTISPECIES: DUF1217 domain-containing protein [unclassified Roseitalea]
MNTTLISFNQIARDMDASIGRLSERADIQREVDYYRETIEAIKSPEDLVADTRLFDFAMRAHGLEDMAYAKAFMLKVMKEGRDADDAFANTLTDPRYRDFAATFDFARYGETATTFTKAREGVVERYLVQSLEAEAGASDPGVRLALYFQRKAPQIDNYYAILADKALAEVVRTSLGLPDSMAMLDIDRQVEIISEKLSLDDLKDPEKIDEMLQRFANLWQLKGGGPQAGQSTVASLLMPSASRALSPDLLLQMQQLGR